MATRTLNIRHADNTTTRVTLTGGSGSWKMEGATLTKRGSASGYWEGLFASPTLLSPDRQRTVAASTLRGLVSVTLQALSDAKARYEAELAAQEPTPEPSRLTQGERDVLELILEHTAECGFACADEVRASMGMGRHAFAGTVGALHGKGLVSSESHRANGRGSLVTQLVPSSEIRERLEDGEDPSAIFAELS